MFGIGMQEIIVILVVALLVVGPRKLPDLAKSLGKGLQELKKATDGVTETVRETLKPDEVKDDLNNIKDSLLYGNKDEGIKNSPPKDESSKSQP